MAPDNISTAYSRGSGEGLLEPILPSIIRYHGMKEAFESYFGCSIYDPNLNKEAASWAAAWRASAEAFEKRHPQISTRIPATESLPTHLYSVLGYVVSGPLTANGTDPFVDIVSYDPNRGAWLQYLGGDEDDAVVQVSHWMKKPENPKWP